MIYIVDYFDVDQKRRTTEVSAEIPAKFAEDIETMKPLIAKHLRRPLHILTITRKGGQDGRKG